MLALSEIVALADRTAMTRREAVAEDELLDLIEPATPDRVAALDEARSIFLAEWWIGNADSEKLAREEISVLSETQDVVALTGAGTTDGGQEYIGFIFCLSITPEASSGALN